MLDINNIRSDPEAVRQALLKRLDELDEVRWMIRTSFFRIGV